MKNTMTSNYINNISNSQINKYIKKIPKIKLFLYLLSLYSIIVVLFNTSQILNISTHFLTLIVSYIILELIYTKILKLKSLNKDTMLISILILFLIIFPLELSIETAITNFILILSLFIIKSIRYKNKPIVNPVVGSSIIAGIILFFSQYIFRNDTLFISWWGASFAGIIGFLIITILILITGILFKKLPIIIAFLATQISILIFFNELSIYSITLFLVGIMLIELKTSPIKFYEQIGYGIIGALLVAFFHYAIFDIDTQVLSIGIANVLFLGYKEIKTKI